MMTTPPRPTHARTSPCAGCSPQPRRQAAPGVVVHYVHRRKTSTEAGPPCASLELRPAPTLRRHRGRHPPGPFVEVSVAPTLMQPAFEEHVASDVGRASPR